MLQLHTRYRQPGGEDKVVDSEARVLKGAGHEVRQLIEHNPASTAAAAGNLLLSPWNPRATKRVGRVVEEFAPDVAHVHNTWFATSPAVIRTLKGLGVPVVMTLHNYRLTCANGLLYRNGAPCELCVGSHPWHAVRYGCYRQSRLASIPGALTIDVHQRIGTWSESVDVFIALTEFQRDLMIRAGLPEQKIVVKPNFVSDPGARLMPPSSSNQVLYVGRVSAEKGVDLLLEAWERAKISDLELVIAGDGPLLDRLRSHYTPRVTFLGAIPPAEVTPLMFRSRAGVMPSRVYEGLPLVLLEFMAAGTGVIGSHFGGIGSVLQRLDSRWSMRPDLGSLVGALGTLSSDRLCDTQGKRHRTAYESLFSPLHVADQLIGIYLDAGSKSSKEAETS